MTDDILKDVRSELAEVRREIQWKLEALARSAADSIKTGYDFAGPNINLYTILVQLEARRRTLEQMVKRLDPTVKA